MDSHLCMQTAWLGSHTPVAPMRRRSCCGRPCRLPTTTGRPTPVGHVFSNPSEDDSSVVDRSNRPSSSPVDAVMFRLAEVLGIVVGGDLSIVSAHFWYTTHTPHACLMYR